MKLYYSSLFYRYLVNHANLSSGVRTVCILIIPLVFLACDPPRTASPQEQHITWRDYGGGPDQSKYVDFDQITKENVKDLAVAWFYPTGDNKTYQFNPLVVDNVMYVLAKNNSLVALEASTGKELWIHANLNGIARRGINYWESKDGKDKRLLFQINNYLQAIDAVTGESILTFGDKGLVDLRQGFDRDPKTLARAQSGTPGKIFENLLILGSGTGESYMSTPGYLRAFDVLTGKIVWTFHTIPKPGEFGYDTWPEDAYQYVGGVNVWGEISVDEERGIAYFPLGSPTFDYYGADRKGSNLFGNCILALDARTGKRLWHYQIVHHDLWDYDLTSAPQLVTVDHDGKKIDAVAVATKHGFLFVFDRVSGEPLWPIEERPVPPSHVKGEEAWPTQPFPTVLPPISRQEMTAADLDSVFLTEEEIQMWKTKLDSIQTGLFVPLSDKLQTLSIPGAVGGVNWGNTASDPENGMVYIISINWPSLYEKLETLEEIESRSTGFRVPTGNSKVYQQNCTACHGEDRKGLVGPSLLDLNQKYSLSDFKQLMVSGRGDMPSFSYMEEGEVESLYNYLTTSGGPPSWGEAPATEKPEGPVVASGGAPGGLERRVLDLKGGRYGAPYPEGVKVAHDRLYLHQWGLDVPFIINPPWSEIMAYDLNKGVLKWRRNLGNDPFANELGIKDTGLFRAQRNGMVVTSTGLLFSTAKDGKVYAFDAENGEELWSANLPTGTEGLPAMYRVNGKQYLVVPTSTPLKFGRDNEPFPGKVDAPGGYIVYALP